jgi:uncharacterized protein
MKLDCLDTKRERLTAILAQFDSLMIAFSGGVDSTFLLAMAHEALKEKVIAVTADSPLHPPWEKKEAIEIAKILGVEHLIFSSQELNQADFRANPPDRCYVCKKRLFEDMVSIANKKGIECIAHGATLDDQDDYRPGFIAAKEGGLKAPPIDAELTKDDIRLLSKKMNLRTWNKPSMACFATRIPYGIPITVENLKLIARAEQIILDLGFTNCRVRLHEKLARIEIDLEEMGKIIDPKIRRIITKEFREIGFLYVAVDLEGYTQGSMNK